MDKYTIGIIAFIIAIFVTGYLTVSRDVSVSHANYNNGICVECGGEYRFTSAQHIENNGDRYYYTCEDCGHTVMTFQLMN